jgi:hypothetical protein
MAAEIYGGIAKMSEAFKRDLANTDTKLFRYLDGPVGAVRVDQDNVVGPEDAFKGRTDLMFLIVAQDINGQRGTDGVRRKVSGHKKSLF